MNPRIRKELDTTTYSGRFAERLRKLREKKKMTLEELSELTGIPHPTISRWENGVSCPVNEQVFLLTEALEINPTRLLIDPKK